MAPSGCEGLRGGVRALPVHRGRAREDVLRSAWKHSMRKDDATLQTLPEDRIHASYGQTWPWLRPEAHALGESENILKYPRSPHPAPGGTLKVSFHMVHGAGFHLASLRPAMALVGAARPALLQRRRTVQPPPWHACQRGVPAARGSSQPASRSSGSVRCSGASGRRAADETGECRGHRSRRRLLCCKTHAAQRASLNCI